MKKPVSRICTVYAPIASKGTCTAVRLKNALAIASLALGLGVGLITGSHTAWATPPNTQPAAPVHTMTTMPADGYRNLTCQQIASLKYQAIKLAQSGQTPQEVYLALTPYPAAALPWRVQYLHTFIASTTSGSTPAYSVAQLQTDCENSGFLARLQTTINSVYCNKLLSSAQTSITHRDNHTATAQQDIAAYQATLGGIPAPGEGSAPLVLQLFIHSHTLLIEDIYNHPAKTLESISAALDANCRMAP